MKSLRTLLQDRLAGGVSAGLFGWLLVLNLFVVAISCGTGVEASAAPPMVMCQPAGSVQAGEPGEAAPFSHDCPYVIGHDGDAALAAASCPGADLGPAFQPFEPLAFAPEAAPSGALDPGRLGLSPCPRGPPRLSA